MQTRRSYVGTRILLLGLFVNLLCACGQEFHAAGGVAQGRQALFRGDYPAALSLFQSAADSDPNYVYGAHLREGPLSFLGRAQYLNGQLGPARDSLQRALAQHKSDNLARLYLGLTVARLGDRESGLRDIAGGMKGIREYLNYITTAFANEWGQFWEPNHDIRKAIDSNLAMAARGKFDWPTLIANAEDIAMKFEQEPDKARHDEEQQLRDPFRR